MLVGGADLYVGLRYTMQTPAVVGATRFCTKRTRGGVSAGVAGRQDLQFEPGRLVSCYGHLFFLRWTPPLDNDPSLGP